MGMTTHDLLWISQDAELLSADEPGWVGDVLHQARVVVVRRAEAPPGFVSVGIRGHKREQRHAALLRLSDVQARRTPESLAAEQKWHHHSVVIPVALLESLTLVAECAERKDLAWGPIGSVGFQLATGIPAASARSDLDVLIRCPTLPDRARLYEFCEAIGMGPAPMDVILEGPRGGVVLEEYLRKADALVKTSRGPRIGVLAW